MANSIDLIVSKEAQKQLDDLYKSLIKTHEEVVAISKLQLSFNGGQSPKSVTDLNEKIKDQAKIQAQLEKQIEKNRLAEIRLQQAREKAFDKYEAQLKKEEARLNASNQLYNKVQQKLNQLNAEYKNLAIQKELSGKLTDSEAKRYDFLSGKITKYDQALKAVDAQMGKYQRNVGNYASAFNPLNNSINQLSREMPAFANSVQTGFMAISNNLPIFFDAIGGIVDKNKELRAEGKPTESVFKQLAGALFSWGTALSVGVTLLTVYGKDLVELAFGLTEAEKAQEKYNNTMMELNTMHTNEQVRMESLRDIILDTTKSEKERIIAQKQLAEIIPEVAKADLNTADGLKIITNLTDRYVKSIINRAKADLLISEISKSEIEKDKAKADNLENQLKWYEKIRLALGGFNTVSGAGSAIKRLSNEEKQRQILIDKLKEQLKLLLQEEDFTKKVGKTKEDINKKETKTKENKAKEDKKINQDTEDYFLAEISRLEKVRNATADTTAEYKSYNEQLEFLKYSLKVLRGELDFEGEGLKLDFEKMGLTADAFAKFRKGGKEAKEETKKTLDEINSYLKGFYDQFGSESGMPTLFKVLNNEIEGFGFKITDNWKVTAVAMMEIGQELTNTLMKQSEARFNAEYSRLEQQKNISIAFAGNSATAKAEIERQYEEKRKSIQRRQAEAEKKQAMFNIAINTAQAVMATLGKAGFAGIPLSVIVGAIGAAQLAMVAAQEIPAFAEGGIHEGGKMLINDAKGSKYQETVVTPDGKVRQYKGRNRIVDAPKGTQIFTPDQWGKQINNMLLKNNIQPLQTNQTNGINKDDLESVFRKYSGSNEVAIDINENGFKKMISSNGRTREILNSRLTTKGRIV